MAHRGKRDRYWDPYIAGALLGALLFASFFLTGQGIGSSGGVNRILVAVEDLGVLRGMGAT